MNNYVYVALTHLIYKSIGSSNANTTILLWLSYTFSAYAHTVLKPYLLSQAHSGDVKRLDIVWDRYIINSLKQLTRKNRGQGMRRRVTPINSIPANWQSFLRNEENKTELFAFLSTQIEMINTEGPELVSTYYEDVVSSSNVDKLGLAPCNHEEADSRIILHVAHGSRHGHTKILIRTVDSDVLVLAIAHFHMLALDELWVALGVGKHFKYIPVHQVANQLGVESCKALPFFHALTGCDVVSSFVGIGKKKLLRHGRHTQM